MLTLIPNWVGPIAVPYGSLAVACGPLDRPSHATSVKLMVIKVAAAISVLIVAAGAVLLLES